MYDPPLLVGLRLTALVAGTMRHAEIRFGLPASSFPLKAAPSLVTNEGLLPASQALRKPTAACQIDDEFDDGIDEIDMANAGMCCGSSNANSEFCAADAAVKEVIGTSEITHQPELHTWKPLQLRSGKWACNHQCKDKTRYFSSYCPLWFRLTIIDVSIFAAAKVWTSRPRHQERRGNPQGRRNNINRN